jgi:hypothetical protein
LATTPSPSKIRVNVPMTSPKNSPKPLDFMSDLSFHKRIQKI